MNDFERKLRQQPFRAPPPELREAIFGRAEAPSHIVEPARGTWRDWFWPSPHAWGALAALWVVFAVLSIGNRSAEHAESTAGAMAEPQFSATLLSYHNTSDLNHVLDFAN
jgi:hypothetical protein